MEIKALMQFLPLTALSTSPKRLVICFYLDLMFFKSMFFESVSNKYVAHGPGMGLSAEDTTEN